jgi:O-antigen/teichoic acid export membrane protein
MSWAYGSYVGGRILTLIATAILARLLTPREFGLVGLALLFMVLFEMLSDLGVSQALVVVGREEELECAETAFVWSVIFGASLSLLIAAMSPLVAAFFHQPALTGLLSVLGLRVLIRSLSATHFALAQKRIDFRPRTYAQIADVVIRGGTGIGLAIAGFGAWSLVLGYVAGTVGLTAVLWITVPWRPSFKPQRKYLRQLLGFGGMLTGVDASAAIFSNTDYFFIGRVLGATELGIYTLGFRLPELLVLNMSIVAGQVLFPAFATLDRDRLGEAFNLSLRYTLMLALPIAAALAILAHPFIIGVFGNQWGRAVAPMQLLTLYALGVTVGIAAGTAYKSIGRAGVLLALSIPRTCLLIVAIAIFIHQGIVAVAACLAVVTSVFAIIGLLLAMRLLAVSARQIWSAVWPPLAATAGMACAVLPIERAIASPWPALLAGTCAATATYLGLLWLFARDALIRLRDTAFPRGARSEEPLPGAPDVTLS